jgi:uncharacterized protein DUF3631/DnaB helicase-like protein
MPKMRARKERELSDLWQIAFDDERRVVGGCLLYPGLMSKCGVLRPTDFTNSESRAVWSVMAELHKQGGPWDLSSVASELARRGTAEPEATLARLTEGIVASVAAIERTAGKVRQMSLRCRVVKEVENFQKSLLDPPSDLNQTLQSALRAVESFATEYEKIHIGISLDGPNPGMSAAGSHVLDEIAAFVQRFVLLTRSELVIISLWIAHTWAIEASDTTPYLSVTSAEKRSGKTRLLEVLELLAHRPWQTGRVTAAALARKIESDSPTLLLDEWDATARGNPEFAETLRGILNSGHRRNGRVSVCVAKGADYKPTDFRVFCPKVIAGIGKLPETIADRAIPIRLKRKAPGEKVERFRLRLVSGDASIIKSRLSTWISSQLQYLKEARPALPEFLSDRQQDGAEPLLAIAEAAGGDWPSQARVALMELYSSSNAADESVGVSLLSDIRQIFSEKDTEEMASKELVDTLAKIEGRPWPKWDHSGAITPNTLARLLAPFDIYPRNLRMGRLVVKGYKRQHFSDQWNRYLSPPVTRVSGLADATPPQVATELPRVQLGKKLPEPYAAPSDTTLRPIEWCSDVAVR